MKKFAIGFLTIGLFFGFVQSASAHVYQTDGVITVLMHVNPDDDPIVGQPAAMLFEMTDSTNHFQAADCDCGITVSNQGKQLLAGSLLRLDAGPSVYGFTMPFTFPTKAVYSIVVTGKPKAVGEFQGFQVQYDLRVDRGQGQASHAAIYWPWVVAGILIIIAAAGFLDRRNKKSVHKR